MWEQLRAQKEWSKEWRKTVIPSPVAGQRFPPHDAFTTPQEAVSSVPFVLSSYPNHSLHLSGKLAQGFHHHRLWQSAYDWFRQEDPNCFQLSNKRLCTWALDLSWGLRRTDCPTGTIPAPGNPPSYLTKAALLQERWNLSQLEYSSKIESSWTLSRTSCKSKLVLLRAQAKLEGVRGAWTPPLMFTGSLETRRNPPKPMLHSLQNYFLEGLGYSSCLLLRPTLAQISCWAENEAWDLSLLLPLLPSPLWIPIPSWSLTVRKGTRRWPQVVGRIQRDPEWKRTRVSAEKKSAHLLTAKGQFPRGLTEASNDRAPWRWEN